MHTKLITIDKNIPLPRRNHNRIGKSKYPFDKMEVGDSFFCEGKAAAMSVHLANKRGGFTSRSVEGGTRVWRVA